MRTHHVGAEGWTHRNELQYEEPQRPADAEDAVQHGDDVEAGARPLLYGNVPALSASVPWVTIASIIVIIRC